MTTLAANLSDSATEMRVNAADSTPAPYYQIGDEIVRLLQNSTTVQTGPVSPNRELDLTLWQIERGDAETTPAAHLSGATLEPLWPQVPGAGGPGGTPTLADVLAAGESVTDGQIIRGPDAGNLEARIILTDGGGTDGGYATIQGGLSSLGSAGGLFLKGGNADGGNPAELQLYGASATDPGKAALYSDETFGTDGQVLTSDSFNATWQSVLTSDAGAPGSSFVSLLYLDTTPVSGGCYAWNGSAYTKISAAP